MILFAASFPVKTIFVLLCSPCSKRLQELYEASEKRNAASELRISKLESKHAQLKKMIFGSRQRFVPLPSAHPQLSLGIESEPVAASIVAVDPQPLLHPGRMKLPEDLHREEIIIEPAGDLTGCKMMGEEVTEVLEYASGELFAKKYKRLKYVKPDNTGILIGSLAFVPLKKRGPSRVTHTNTD